MQKRRVGYRVSEPLLVDLRWALLTEGISKKGKSRWICAAIRELFLLGPSGILEEDLSSGDRVNPNSITDVVTMDADLCLSFSGMIYNLRRLNPMLEDLQSMLIRAAIRRAVKRVKGA